MSDYMRIDWAEVRRGDVLMHENGDRLTVTTADPDTDTRQLLVGGAWRVIGSLAATGFTPHRKVEPLPTEPGAYHDKDGDYWLLDRAGNWYDWSSLREPNPRGGSPDTYAPLTRLVPMPTEEALDKAVSGIENRVTIGGEMARFKLPEAGRREIVSSVMSLLEGESND